MRHIVDKIKKMMINDIVIVSFTNKADEYFDNTIRYIYKNIGKMKYDSDEYFELRNEIEAMGNSVMLVAEEADMALVNRLMWEVLNVKGCAYADMDDPYKVESSVTKKDKMLWDVQANLSGEDDQASMSGWKNSYNNEEFTPEELEEYINDSVIKLKPYLNKESTRVLEVGVGSGMIAHRIAPLCKEYVGSDISRIVLDRLHALNEANGIDNMTLYNCGADEISSINKKYDVIFMSSVTEYFSGVNYMRKVLEDCIDNIEQNGHILIADVFGLETKEMYRESVERYASEHPGCRYKKDFSHELFLSKRLWEDFGRTIDGIKSVEVLPKEGIIDNEINKFRYDVMIEVDRRIMKYADARTLNRFQTVLETACEHRQEMC